MSPPRTRSRPELYPSPNLNLLGRVALPVMSLKIMKKTRPSVTSRPPVDQIAPQTSQPALGPELILVPLLAVDPDDRGEDHREHGIGVHEGAPDHRDQRERQKPAPGKPSAFNKNEPSPTATTAR